MEGSLVAYKVFTNGSVLNASEINDNLMNQSVMVFSNSTARSAALTSPVEGMVTYLEDTEAYENYNGTAWVGFGNSAILQVVSTTKTDVFTASLLTGTVTAITGLTASITPSSATSKILVLASITSGSSDNRTGLKFILKRDSTSIALGNAAGSRTRATSASFGGATGLGEFGESANTISVNHLDSPSSTSAITYGFDVGHGLSTTATLYINRSITDGDFAYLGRFASTITLMEVAG
jgi:hypothetical protein